MRRASDFPHDAWWFGRSARRGADSRGASPFTPGEVRARAGKGDPSRAPGQGPLTTCQSHLLSDKGPLQVGGSNGRTGVEGCQCGLAFASVGAGGPGLRESECGREGKEGAGGGHGGGEARRRARAPPGRPCLPARPPRARPPKPTRLPPKGPGVPPSPPTSPALSQLLASGASAPRGSAVPRACESWRGPFR